MSHPYCSLPLINIFLLWFSTFCSLSPATSRLWIVNTLSDRFYEFSPILRLHHTFTTIQFWCWCAIKSCDFPFFRGLLPIIRWKLTQQWSSRIDCAQSAAGGLRRYLSKYRTAASVSDNRSSQEIRIGQEYEGFSFRSRQPAD